MGLEGDYVLILHRHAPGIKLSCYLCIPLPQCRGRQNVQMRRGGRLRIFYHTEIAFRWIDHQFLCRSKRDESANLIFNLKLGWVEGAYLQANLEFAMRVHSAWLLFHNRQQHFLCSRGAKIGELASISALGPADSALTHFGFGREPSVSDVFLLFFINDCFCILRGPFGPIF